VAVSAGGVFAAAFVTCLIPVPLRTISEGVIWVPDEALVRTESDGFLVEVVAEPGSRVRAGDVLIIAEDPELVAEVRSLEWRLRALEARHSQMRLDDKVEAEVLRDEIRYAEQALDRARQRESDLVVRSRVDGRFVVPVPEDLPGRFVRKGDLLAYVVDLDTVTVRAAIPQDQIDLVRQRTREVEMRLSEHLSRVLPARVTRVVPTATERLPSTALGTAGGGRVAVDPRDQAGATAMTKVFSLELELGADVELDRVGERVYVRFDHGYEALVRQGYRTFRQLFLSRFNV
jgi:putative peptide zinc metalloprotease protein